MKKLWRLLYRALHLIALAFLIFLFAQALPFDLLAIAFAGDALAFFEIAATIWLAAQVTRVKWMAAYARFLVGRTIRRARIRVQRAVRRAARRHPPPKDDGGHRPAFA